MPLISLYTFSENGNISITVYIIDSINTIPSLLLYHISPPFVSIFVLFASRFSLNFSKCRICYRNVIDYMTGLRPTKKCYPFHFRHSVERLVCPSKVYLLTVISHHKFVDFVLIAFRSFQISWMRVKSWFRYDLYDYTIAIQ